MIVSNTGRAEVKTFQFDYFNYKAVGVIYLDNAEYEVSIYSPKGVVENTWNGVFSTSFDIKSDIWNYVKEKWNLQREKKLIENWFYSMRNTI